MKLSTSTLISLKSKVFAKIARELEIANRDDCLQEFLDKYDIIFEEEYMPIQPRTMKVLVLGSLAGSLKEFQNTAKKIGIPDNNIEFIEDYDKLKRFSVAKLEYSNEYSDIICGPIPHKQVGMGNENSLLAHIKREPEKFPRLITAIANNKLKITITNFKSSIYKTRYFETISQ